MKTLFISLGGSPPAWYRCGLPANQLNIDWIGLVDGPPGIGQDIAGNVEEYPDDKYELFIAQQAKGNDWLRWIKDKQSSGQKVLYEVDDFLHGVNRIKGHSQKNKFHKKAIKEYVECMKQCDGMICSTQFLSDQYKKYNPNQFVCLNGIDTARYRRIEFPERDKIVIGWAGGTGHNNAIGPWLEAVSEIMLHHENVLFVSIGVRYGEIMNERHPGRGLAVPWTTLENLPYTLTHFDCYIAPFHDSKYFRSKSDLRWLESSAMGIPGVLSPEVYLEVEDEQTGLLADTQEMATKQLERLVTDEELRHKIGKQAQEYVCQYRDIRETAKQWEMVIEKQSSVSALSI